MASTHKSKSTRITHITLNLNVDIFSLRSHFLQKTARCFGYPCVWPTEYEIHSRAAQQFWRWGCQKIFDPELWLTWGHKTGYYSFHYGNYDV